MQKWFVWKKIRTVLTCLGLSVMIYAEVIFTRRANEEAALHHEKHQIKQFQKILDTPHNSDDITSRAIALGATIAALFQCFVYVKQLSVARTQAEIMNRQANLSNQQATLMERQLKATEVSADASRVASQAALATIDRPYLHVTKFCYTTLNCIVGSGQNNYISATINLCIKNVGNSPAVILNIKYIVAVKDRPRIIYNLLEIRHPLIITEIH